MALPSPHPPRPRRRWLVVGILLLALALRVVDVQATSYRAVNDAGTYNRFASTIARHGDYETGSAPGSGAGGSRGPTAYFPPAYPYALALVDLIDGHTHGHRAALHGERLAGAALGTLAAGLAGLIALEAFGAGPALATLALAAVDPALVELSGVLAAENLLVVLELAAVWAGLRIARAGDERRRCGWIVAAGVLTGLATLAHENGALLLLPLVGVAAAGGVKRGPGRAPGRAAAARPGRRRAGAAALLLLATAATVAPWTIRNAVELHHFVPVSDETGITLRGAYNPPSSAAHPTRWRWRFFWTIPEDGDLRRGAGALSEIALGDRLQHRALHYIADHPAAPLSVGAHNLARMLELDGTPAWHASARAVDLSVGEARIGVIAFWVLAGLALGGLATRPVRAGPRWIWWVPALFGLSVVFVNVETPRFREPIDPFLILLAGCAVDAALRGRARGRLTQRGVSSSSRRALAGSPPR